MTKIFAGIVLFNPNYERLIENMDAIVNQVDTIILSDNGSPDSVVDEIRKKYGEKICYSCNNNNIGIAGALNSIFRIAISNKAESVLTLDQDSIMPPNSVDQLRSLLCDDVAIVSPTIIDLNRQKNVIPSNAITEIGRCITSGSLTSVKAWEKVGGFDESMFIDGVDFDFCDRLKGHHYRILQLRNVQLKHEIGKIATHHFFGIPVIVRNHSAFRKYYMARNIIYLDRKENSSAYPFITYLRIAKLLVITALYEDGKKEKISAILRGADAGSKQAVLLDNGECYKQET